MKIQFNTSLAISKLFHERLFQFLPTNLDLSQDYMEFSFQGSTGSFWQRKVSFSKTSDFYLTKVKEKKKCIVWEYFMFQIFHSDV